MDDQMYTQVRMYTTNKGIAYGLADPYPSYVSCSKKSSGVQFLHALPRYAAFPLPPLVVTNS